MLAAESEDRFLDLAVHLPSEAGEALLAYAAGGKLEKPAPLPAANPLQHPDALRRFRIIDEQDRIRRHIRIFVNGEQVRDLAHRLNGTDEVIIVQALSGG